MESRKKPQAEGKPDRQFGGTLGSKQKGDLKPEEPVAGQLQPGPSGSSSQGKPAPEGIGGQLGGIGSTTPPRGDRPAATPPIQPSPARRRSGCFGLTLLAFAVLGTLAARF